MRVGKSDAGWETSVMPVDLTAKGKDLFGKDRLVREISMEKVSKLLMNGYRASIRCIETSYSSARQTLNSSDLPVVAKSKECMPKRDSSLCKDTLSLVKRL